jgi:hypothetical protein
MIPELLMRHVALALYEMQYFVHNDLIFLREHGGRVMRSILYYCGDCPEGRLRRGRP